VPNEEITRSLVQAAAVQYIITRLITTTTKVPKKEYVPNSLAAVSSGETDGEAINTITEESVLEAATDAAAGMCACVCIFVICGVCDIFAHMSFVLTSPLPLPLSLSLSLPLHHPTSHRRVCCDL
jgi:hypothetical protein